MPQHTTILTVEANPSGPPEGSPMEAFKWKMVKGPNGYEVRVVQTGDGQRHHRSVSVSQDIATEWLDCLKAVRVPLVLEASSSCDGYQFSYSADADDAGIKLHWQNNPPVGAEQLDEFVDWLWSLIPKEWERHSIQEDAERLLFDPLSPL